MRDAMGSKKHDVDIILPFVAREQSRNMQCGKV